MRFFRKFWNCRRAIELLMKKNLTRSVFRLSRNFRATSLSGATICLRLPAGKRGNTNANCFRITSTFCRNHSTGLSSRSMIRSHATTRKRRCDRSSNPSGENARFKERRSKKRAESRSIAKSILLPQLPRAICTRKLNFGSLIPSSGLSSPYRSVVFLKQLHKR